MNEIVEANITYLRRKKKKTLDSERHLSLLLTNIPFLL